MRTTYKLLIITVLITIQHFAMGQNYLISNYQNQTLSTCSGYFFDSGGSSAGAQQNESYIMSMVSDDTINFINLSFSFWDLSLGDTLLIFDGANISSPLVHVFTKNMSPVGIKIAPTTNNPSKKITLAWKSINSGSSWLALISCGYPCQPFQTTLSAPNGILNNGFLDVCYGNTSTFTAIPSFPSNNQYYTQTSTGSSYYWDFGIGEQLGSSTETEVFQNPAIRNFSLRVLDDYGCPSSNNINLICRVSQLPTFNGTQINGNTFCEGDTLDFVIHYQKPLIKNKPEITAYLIDPSFIPDGAGTSLVKTINISGYPNLFIDNSNVILDSVFANLEHSYLGDLNINLTCPNGSTATLKKYPGGSGTFLGEPIDNQSNLNPGIGYSYSWDRDAIYSMVGMSGIYSHSFTDQSGSFYSNSGFLPPSGAYPSNSTASAPYPQMIYSPITPFTVLNGCPVNGAWTLTVNDYLLIDNGYLFAWGLKIKNGNFSNISFANFIDSSFWSGNALFQQQSLFSSIGFPTNDGSQSFTATIIDDFGCAYDTTITAQILNTPFVNLGSDTTIYINTNILLDAGNQGSTYLWSNGETAQTTFWDSSNLVLNNNTIHVSVNDGNCSNSDTIVIFLNSTIGLDEESNLQKITIFPVPTAGELNIIGEFDYLEIAQTDGKILIKSKRTEKINLASLESGSYLIRFFKGDKSSSRVFTKN